MKKTLHIILFLILSPALVKGQTINWETETGLTPPIAFTDGQEITNFAGTGLNVRINVDIVSSQPRITTANPTVVTTGGARTDCRFTLTFLNGTANIRINNFENLQAGEIITLSNPDGENITIRQTTNNGGALMTIDGATVPAINTNVVEDDSVVIQEVNNGAGTQWWARMNNISSFTWEYDEATGTSATEGFTLTLLSTALPVELISFSSKVTINNEVALKWKTASEINNDYFTVERSKNGLDWLDVSEIDGAGSSSSLLNYFKIDQNPYSGTSYYRLKQTDFDGQFEYSDILSVKVDNQTSSKIQIYPNPTDNIIRIIGDESELKEITVYNIFGQDITSTTLQIIMEGSTQAKIDLSGLNKGIYLLKTKTTTNKVYKQ